MKSNDIEFIDKMEKLALLIGYRLDKEKFYGTSFTFYNTAGRKLNCRNDGKRFSISAMLPTSRAYYRTHKDGNFDLKSIDVRKLANSIKSRILSGYDDAYEVAKKERIEYLRKNREDRENQQNIYNCCAKYFDFINYEDRQKFIVIQKYPHFSSVSVSKVHRGYDVNFNSIDGDMLVKFFAWLKQQTEN